VLTTGVSSVRSDLVYDPISDDVTQKGHAEAVVWDSDGNNLKSKPVATQNQYGPSNKKYKSVALPNQIFLSAYYPVGQGAMLTARAHHFLGQPGGYSAESLLSVDCRFGDEPVISSSPAPQNEPLNDGG